MAAFDAAHTAVVTEFGTTDVERAVALARQLTTTTVSSLSSQQPAGSVADAVTDVAAQFAGSVDGMASSLTTAPDGMTIIILLSMASSTSSGEVSATPHPASRSSRQTTITVCSSPPTCPPAAMHRAWRCPTAPSSRSPLARWTRCPTRLRRAFLHVRRVRVELVDGSGSVAGVHDLGRAPYLRPSSGGMQTLIAIGDVPAT